MRYQVPLYQFKKEEEIVGEIIVTKNSLGIFEIVSGKKIRMTTGNLKVADMISTNSVYIKSCDLNGCHLVVPMGTVKGVHKKRFYNHDKYVKEHKKIKILLK